MSTDIKTATADGDAGTRWLSSPDALNRSPTETIRPRLSRSVAIEALASLGARPTALEGRLTLDEPIAKGGMAIVHSGRQVALDREVAVKVLRTDRSDRAVLALLREAWVTGRLEHPNVVPIYDLAVDDEGTPMVIMRRIHGTDWGDLIDASDRVRDEFRAIDLLEWNLRILMQVCNVVHFAHSRHIVHRDLKPQNVMIGGFGEVYVVDWGIAVSLDDAEQPYLRGSGELAGTPAYMAPEMLSGTIDAISEQTDVYLLGSILFEILTGRPPHHAPRVLDVLENVRSRSPALPAKAPEELAAICRAALHADPRQRIASADDLRLALQGFLAHRGSNALAAEASLSLERLQTEVVSADLEDQRVRAHIYNLYGECRFGFRSALKQWEENPKAADGLSEATRLLIEAELDHGDPRAASALMSELPEPDAVLEERVDAARQEQDEERKSIEAYARVGRSLSPAKGRRARVGVIATVGLIFSLRPLLVPEDGHGQYMVSGVLGLSLILLLVYIGRRALLASTFNRRAIAILIAVFVANLVLRSVAMVAELTLAEAAGHQTAFFFFALFATSILLEHRLWPATLTYMAGYAVVAIWPEHRLLTMALCHTCFTATAVLVWWNHDKARARPATSADHGAVSPPAEVDPPADGAGIDLQSRR